MNIKRAKRAAVLVLSGAAFFIVTASCGGTLIMQPQTQAAYKQGNLDISVSVKNKGDEAAHEVQATAESQGVDWESPVLPALEPGADHAFKFHQPIKALGPGNYPLLMRIRYQDANQYPFTALSAVLYLNGPDTASEVLGILNQATTGGRLTLSLKNLSDTQKKLRIRLFMPHELSARPGSLDMVLAPSQETSVRMKVSNFSALPGSNYPVYAVIEYDEGGIHNTALAPGSVSVTERKGLAGHYSKLLWAIMAVALLIFIGTNAATAWKRR